ncbi:MAG: hypothetical protein HYR51_00160 [Candidatus Rokubacteria bacterium]|nr:hypothetical protein [Candidatus Rokubacteria bacterium]
MPPTVTSLLRGSGPRFARDAGGPVLAFYVGWKLAGLGAGIAAGTAIGYLAPPVVANGCTGWRSSGP